jgi:hypothetical protein
MDHGLAIEAMRRTGGAAELRIGRGVCAAQLVSFQALSLNNPRHGVNLRVEPVCDRSAVLIGDLHQEISSLGNNYVVVHGLAWHPTSDGAIVEADDVMECRRE